MGVNVFPQTNQFEACTQPSPTEFQEIYDVEVGDKNGRVQSETNQVSMLPALDTRICQFPSDSSLCFQLKGKPKARFLRVTICSGWDDFASIRRISIEGAKT
jgi:hypothetical protein